MNVYVNGNHHIVLNAFLYPSSFVEIAGFKKDGLYKIEIKHPMFDAKIFTNVHDTEMPLCILDEMKVTVEQLKNVQEIRL